MLSVVISGKDHPVEVIIHIFLWEPGLLTAIRKAHEIDLLLYACSTDKPDLIAQCLWRQRSSQNFPSLYPCILDLLVLSEKQKTNKTHLSGYQLPTVLWFFFFQRTNMASIVVYAWHRKVLAHSGLELLTTWTHFQMSLMVFVQLFLSQFMCISH